MKTVKELLEQNASVDAFRILEHRIRSYELFFVHQSLETVRATDTADIEATVYVDHDGFRGDSAFAAPESLSEEELNEKISLAVRRARLVCNKPYTLTRGESAPCVYLDTNLNEEAPETLARRIADACFAADTEEGGSINALEIFLDREETRVVNSLGVDRSQVKYRVMIEAIPTFTRGGESVELYEDLRFSEFDPERVTGMIREKMREVRDRFSAQKPQTPLQTNVILRAKEISSLMEEFSNELNYASVYAHSNLHALGDDLQENAAGDCDKITLTAKGTLPQSVFSKAFDEDGTSLADTCLIRDGKVENYYGANRFGQYLEIPVPSGNLPCLRLEPGTLSEDLLEQTPHLECVSLSGLQVDLYNDYIGGEIRLGYYFDGKTKTPVTGITMSGKLSEVLRGLRLSERTGTYNAYEGAEKLLLRDMQIL